jgi:hypothetical protein
MRPLACRDCGFEPCQRRGCLSLVSVVCCQVEVSAPGLSLIQRIPTECGVSECDHVVWIMGGPGLLGVVASWKKKTVPIISITLLHNLSQL